MAGPLCRGLLPPWPRKDKTPWTLRSLGRFVVQGVYGVGVADERARASQLLEALEATEWHREDGHGPPECTVCHGLGDMPEGPYAGHRPDCIVGQALGREPGRGDPRLVAEADDLAESLGGLFR